VRNGSSDLRPRWTGISFLKMVAEYTAAGGGRGRMVHAYFPEQFSPGGGQAPPS